MRFALGLATLSLLSGCASAFTCQDACDGTQIKSCTIRCTGQDPDSCHREYGGVDCATQMGSSGQPLTCRLRLDGSGGRYPWCLDVGKGRCDPKEGVRCDGPHHVTTCLATSEGGYRQPTEGGCPLPTECVQDEGQVRCVDSPRVSCTKAQFPACVDANTIKMCLGNAETGTGLRIGVCSTDGTVHCVGEPGAAYCQ